MRSIKIPLFSVGVGVGEEDAAKANGFETEGRNEMEWILLMFDPVYDPFTCYHLEIRSVLEFA